MTILKNKLSSQVLTKHFTLQSVIHQIHKLGYDFFFPNQDPVGSGTFFQNKNQPDLDPLADSFF